MDSHHSAALALSKLTSASTLDDALGFLRRKHALDAQAAERYRVEPYVVAADIYGGEAYPGRGGWTWYTGSAGWLYRFAVEGLLGLRREGNRLFIQPTLPPEWNRFEASVELDGKRHAIVAERKPGGETYDVRVNGDALSDLSAGYALPAAG